MYHRGTFEVTVVESFAAAHFLKHYHGRCENLHGHNYRVKVSVLGDELDEGGMLLDFGILKTAVREIISELDHSLMNDHDFFKKGDPSAERIAYFLYLELREKFPSHRFSRIEVSETEKNTAAFIPEDRTGRREDK